MKFLENIAINPQVNLKKGKRYPFIDMASVSTQSREPNYISEKIFNSGVKFQKGDTVIARIEPCLQNGKKFYCKNIDSGFGSTEYLVFRPKNSNVDSLYLYYFMQQRFIQQKMINSMSGATGRQRVNNSVFNDLEISLPPLYIQQKIALILSAYDDLIDNNRRQIKLLEEAAQRLYKEWFVDLRFPGHEDVKIIDGVPEGWRVGTLGEIVGRLEAGSRPKGGINNLLSEGVASVGAENVLGLGQYNFASEKLISQEFFNKMSKGKIADKDILIYKDGAYIGRTSLFQDGFPHKMSAVNEHVFLLHTLDEQFQYYTFFTLYRKEYFMKIQKLNKNAAQPGINKNAIMSLEILLPPAEIVEKFSEYVTASMSNIFVKAKQIKFLSEARDRLLPKLMSGEISLEEMKS